MPTSAVHLGHHSWSSPVHPWRPGSHSREDLAAVLKRPDPLPPRVERRAFDLRTFRLWLPGHEEADRITATPAVFDDYFESLQLASPDSPLFRGLLARSGAEELHGEHMEKATLRELIGLT
ncbi:MAG: hypothetical protein JW820_15575 [Spirochaetales bacterium]|nr:hypothetical protein [Spirochaetales bacterium]